jgi:Putative peptidoglycan binding domain
MVGIGMGGIIGMGLKIVANREKIAAVWGELVPAIEAVRKNYPKVKELFDDLGLKTPTPKQEPESFSVEWLQESLNKVDNAGLVVDGDYGEATRGAVAEYQRAHPPLVIDGWAGVATQASIYEELAKRK